MMTMPISEEFLTKAWKAQLDTGMQVLEAIFEGVGKARESQLAAAVEAHAALVATRKSLEKARSMQDLSRIQLEWLTQNAGRAAAYWSGLGILGRETQERVARCLCDTAPFTAWLQSARKDAGATPAPLGSAIESAWKTWFDAVSKLQPALPAASSAKQPA